MRAPYAAEELGHGDAENAYGASSIGMWPTPGSTDLVGAEQRRRAAARCPSRSVVLAPDHERRHVDAGAQLGAGRGSSSAGRTPAPPAPPRPRRAAALAAHRRIDAVEAGHADEPAEHQPCAAAAATRRPGPTAARVRGQRAVERACTAPRPAQLQRRSSPPASTATSADDRAARPPRPPRAARRTSARQRRAARRPSRATASASRRASAVERERLEHVRAAVAGQVDGDHAMRPRASRSANGAQIGARAGQAVQQHHRRARCPTPPALTRRPSTANVTVVHDQEATSRAAADEYRERSALNWEQAAAGWERERERLREMGGPITAWLIEHLELASGRDGARARLRPGRRRPRGCAARSPGRAR